MRRLLRTLLWICALAVLAVVAGGLLLLEDRPLVADVGPPRPEDVAATRSFVKEVRREATGLDPEADGLVEISEDEANSILTLAGRMIPGLRARVEVRDGKVRGEASIPVRWPGGRKWINAEGVAPAFETRPTLESLSLGGVALPPGPMIEVARVGANLVLGNRAGDVFLSSARRLEIEDRRMRIALDLDEEGKSGFIQGVFGAVRGAEMPDIAVIDGYYAEIRRAIDDGTLPATGSYLPYLRFMLTRVYEDSSDETLANIYTAAVFGLAKACGAKDFTLIVGRFAGDSLKNFGDWERDCTAVEFAGRIDTRRHFTTAAAIQAASNRGTSVSVGEFKELYDSRGWKEGGFDFTDIAANNSGIRLSNLVMSGTRADLRRTIDLIGAEGDLLADFSQVPQIMLRGDFERRFGTIDSAEYKAMLDRIEALVDAATIHRPRE